jgi:hypothetical protein
MRIDAPQNDRSFLEQSSRAHARRKSICAKIERAAAVDELGGVRPFHHDPRAAMTDINQRMRR